MPPSPLGKRLIAALLCGFLLTSVTGCVISPAPVYVEPGYPSPGIGWNWQFHTYFGWGWHHPHHGWHRGWR